MKSYLLPLALAAVTFAACNDGAADRTTDADVNEASFPLPNRDIEPRESPTTTLDNTLEAFKAYGGDVTALPISAAVGNIDTWLNMIGPDEIDKNKRAPGNYADDVDGATMAVTGNLRELRDALSADEVNGQLTGVLLLTLAEDARRAAPNSTGISALASALKAGGEKLVSHTVTGDSPLSQTLGAVAGKMGDITTLPANAATQNVNLWIGRLSGMRGADGIVKDLRSLKTELSAPSIDGEKVSKLLFELSEGTSDMADGNMSLETLAYALEAGGWRLQGKS